MKRTSIGVDIGEYSVKCVVLEKIRDEYCIKHKKNYRRKDNISFDKWLKSVLEDFTKEHKIRRPEFHFSLSSMTPRVIFRFFNMPKISIKELNKSMRYEIEEKTLVNIDSIYYKWDIIGSDDEEYRIIAVTIEKNFIETLKKIKRFGWTIGSIEPQVISFGRLIEGNTAVIDLGHSGTRLMVYKDGNPVHIQPIEIGGKTLTEKIKEKYPDNPEQAKHEYGAVITDRNIESDPDRFMVSDLILIQIENLARELKQSLRAVEVRENITIETIYYTGNTAKLRYLIDYLSRELGHDLYPLNLTAKSFSETEDYFFASASGAALFREHPYFTRINFAKVLASRKITSKSIFFVLLGFLIAFQSAISALNIKADNYIKTLDRTRNELESRLNSVRNRIQNYEKTIIKYQEAEDVVKILKNQKKNLSQILFQLPDRTPKGIAITEILIFPEYTVFKGKSKNYSDVGFFAIALEELGRVTINTISPSLEFTLTLYEKVEDSIHEPEEFPIPEPVSREEPRG